MMSEPASPEPADLKCGHLKIEEDLRPLYAFGHVEMNVVDIKKTGEFLLGIGLREVVIEETYIILEVRGGTHLVIAPTDIPVEPGADAPFDLMVDEIDQVHKLFTDQHLAPTEIGDNGIHRWFTCMEPGGHKITVNSSHATGLPV